MSAKGNWKPVTMGGLTGIVLGAGIMYAVKPSSVDTAERTADTGNVSPIDTAQSAEAVPAILPVSDDLSFSEAFAAGRAASGPGGLFAWRGNLYGTYYADEWNAMSDEEKNLFADRANTAVRGAATEVPQAPEIGVEEDLMADNDVQLSETDTEEDVFTDNDVHVARVTTENQAIEEKESFEDLFPKNTVSWEDLSSEDNDVRVVGYGDVEVEGSESVYVEEVEINGQRVAVIDVDKDGEADLVMTDLNHNRQMDKGEVIDLHTGEALTFTNDEAADDFSETTDNDGSMGVEPALL